MPVQGERGGDPTSPAWAADGKSMDGGAKAGFIVVQSWAWSVSSRSQAAGEAKPDENVRNGRSIPGQ